ncbi:MAG: hypothetical protein AB7N70_34915 [Dehalococcoidia bacterium]
MTKTIAETAGALREGITRGYVRAVEAVEWARLETIRGRDEHAPLLLDLGRADPESVEAILRILGQLSWGARPEAIGRLAAAELHDRLAAGSMDPTTATLLMRQLVKDGYTPEPDFESASRRFDADVTEAGQDRARLAEIETALREFLARYRSEPDQLESRDASDRLLLTIERATDATLEVVVEVAWSSWSGAGRVRMERERLAEFARRLGDFAAHRIGTARFETADGAASGRLALVASEHGRARRAAVSIDLVADREAEPPRAPSRLEVVAPTEHAMLAEFGADLAQLAHASEGSVRLRLVARWVEGS